MRVLHLNSELFLGGGLERIIVDLMNENQRASNYLCVVNDKWSKEYIEMLDSNKLLLCNRSEGTKNPFVNLNVIYKTYKFIKNNSIDIIHCHDTFSLKFAYLLKKISNVKVVLTVHHIKLINKGLMKYPIDRYIAISQAVYKTINKYVPEERITLIYNGVYLKRFYNNNRFTERKNVINIACVARLVPEIKGQDILLKALDTLKNSYKHKNFKCFFAGNGTQETINELKSLVREYNLEDNVEFLGNMSNIEELYADTDIFVLPSRNEGFGLVVVEALAAGCSVVVSKLEGPLEIVKENEEYGLYFEKENYKELAGKLCALIRDTDYLKKYKKNNKTMEYIEREYSLEKMIKRYNEVYNEILN